MNIKRIITIVKRILPIIGIILLIIILTTLDFEKIYHIFLKINPCIIGAFVTIFETKKIYKFELNEITSRRFAKYMEKYMEFYENLATIVKRNIPKKIKKPLIIDLGVGPGLLSRAMYKSIPGAEIIGLDPSFDMLQLARKNSELKIILGSSENIPLKNNSADIVVSRFSLTYWDKPKNSFSEIYRVLKPGGKVIIEALNKEFSKWKLFGVKIHMILNQSGIDVARYHADAYKTAYSMGCVEKFLRDLGLNISYREGNKKDWKFIIIASKN
jgi:ubiquinone/menaquinone biosynthesis C-methylase UbiE